MTTRRISSRQLSRAEVTRADICGAARRFTSPPTPSRRFATNHAQKRGREKPLVAVDSPIAAGRRLRSDHLLLCSNPRFGGRSVKQPVPLPNRGAQLWSEEKKKTDSPNLSQIFLKKIQGRRQGVRETPDCLIAGLLTGCVWSEDESICLCWPAHGIQSSVRARSLPRGFCQLSVALSSYQIILTRVLPLAGSAEEDRLLTNCA